MNSTTAPTGIARCNGWGASHAPSRTEGWSCLPAHSRCAAAGDAVSAGATAAPFLELMVRLRDEDGTLVPPDEFIPAAERYNVMVMVDRWVVNGAIEMLEASLQDRRQLPLLAVNLSGTSINDEDFLEFVLTRLTSEQVARALCFEITETAAVASLAKATS